MTDSTEAEAPAGPWPEPLLQRPLRTVVVAGLWLLALSMLSSYAHANPVIDRQTNQHGVARDPAGQVTDRFKITD